MKKLFIAASILLCSFSAQAAQDPEAVFTPQLRRLPQRPVANGTEKR